MITSVKIAPSKKLQRAALDMLLSMFDGDEAALQEAIKEHLADQTKYAVKAPSIEPTGA